MTAVADTTDANPPLTGRSYGDGCAAAQALDIIGERWALLIVRELVMGPRRFGGLRKALPGIRPNILTARLRELETTGVLRHRWLGAPTSAGVYELTKWGHELQTVLIQLARWNLHSPMQQHQRRPVSLDSIMLALRSRFDAVQARDLQGHIMITLDVEHYALRLNHGQINIKRESVSNPDATLVTSQETLRELVLDARPLNDAERSGQALTTGDRTLLHRLFAAVTPG